MARHVLIVTWVALLALAVAGFTVKSDWLVALFIISPIVAIGAAIVVAPRDTAETQRPAAMWIYRMTIVALVGASLLGVVTSAAGMATDYEGARHFENGPLAALFLLGLVLGYRALIRPTPRRAALPALVVHVIWIPVILLNLSSVMHHPYHRGTATAWEHFPRWCLLAMLGFSALASLLALASFSGTPATIAKATVRS